MNIEIEKTKIDDSTMVASLPKGILLIVALFLMTGGAALQVIFHYPVWPIDYTWESVFIMLLFVFLGPIYLLVAYGLFTRKRWSWKFAIVVASFEVLYEVIRLVFTFQMFTVPTLIGGSIYDLTKAVFMIVVIRYLKRPEIKQWFVENSKSNSLELHHGDTQEN